MRFPNPRFIGGCTIGAKIFEPGRWWVLFKNKDFKREAFEDELLLEQDLFGIRGVESWASDGSSSDTFSGLSLGISSAPLFCADANIKSLALMKNYDILVEKVLRGAKESRGAAGVLREEVKKGYGWTNIVAVDGREVDVLEVGRRVNVKRSREHAARTNHFLLTPGWKVDYHQDAGTKTRMKDASSRLSEAEGLEDIFELLKVHRSTKVANSVCNHGNLHTVYSYVFERKYGRSILHVAHGNPCRNEYVKVEIPFPITEAVAQRIMDSYPSTRCERRSKVPLLASFSGAGKR